MAVLEQMISGESSGGLRATAPAMEIEIGQILELAAFTRMRRQGRAVLKESEPLPADILVCSAGPTKSIMELLDEAAKDLNTSAATQR